MRRAAASSRQPRVRPVGGGRRQFDAVEVGFFARRFARAPDLGGEGGLAVDGDVGREAFVRLGADAFDLHQVRGLLERAVLGAVLDDALRGLLADAREQRELRRHRRC